MGYDIESDPDLNSYSTTALKYLTKSGIGTAGREIVVFSDFLVFLIISVLVVGMIGSFLITFTKLYKVN